MLFRDEPLSALRTLDPLKIYPANPGRSDRTPALRTDGVLGGHDLFEIDFLLSGHAGGLSHGSGWTPFGHFECNGLIATVIGASGRYDRPISLRL
jgi:hypothetical protein